MPYVKEEVPVWEPAKNSMKYDFESYRPNSDDSFVVESNDYEGMTKAAKAVRSAADKRGLKVTTRRIPGTFNTRVWRIK